MLSIAKIDNPNSPNVEKFYQIYQEAQSKYDALCGLTSNNPSREDLSGSRPLSPAMGVSTHVLEAISSRKLPVERMSIRQVKLRYHKLLVNQTLLEYRYIRSYNSILSITNEFFTKSELTVEDEEKGLDLVGVEMQTYTEIEKAFKKLVVIQKNFEQVYAKELVLAGMVPQSGHAQTEGSGMVDCLGNRSS